MHSQHKWGKRTLEGLITVEGIDFCWQLVSEPQRSTEHGYQGLCISVQTEDKCHRELILQYPYPKTKFGSPLPLPQRPHFSIGAVERDVRQAIAAGWEPTSRGKTFIFQLLGSPN
jgi:hypothetical protein